MQITWTDLAVADLDHIEAYIIHKNSPPVAVNVVLKIIDTTEMILLDHPYAGRPGRVKGTRELIMDGIPYTVIYRQASRKNQIQILRVMHDAQ